MITQSPSPEPTVQMREAARNRPAGAPAMYQRWQDLLFLHWQFPAATIQASLPQGLAVDTFNGQAYLGIVPFFMRKIRPRFLPAVPGISNFMEMNLRTYVYDSHGVPGVWFYSLDANQWLAVEMARRFFHLPYHHAKMQSERTSSGSIRYQSARKGSPGSTFEYAAGPPLPQPAAGTLEFFLIERYRLYAMAGENLLRGSVSHPPYALHAPQLAAWDEHLLSLNGFAPTDRPPDHAVMSPGVDVEIFALERV